MANFSDMDTPDIIRKGRAYGLKPSLGKKKLKIKLKEAFRFHRQVESSSSEEEQPLEFPDKGSNPKMTKPFQECSTQNKPTSSEFNFETDSESDDTTNKNNDSYRVEMRKVLEARTMLEKLSNKGFRQKLMKALNSSLKMGHMAKSLRSVATSSVGIPRGSRQDMQRWSNRLSPGTSTYSRELNVLLGLSENKKEALVSALTTFSIEQANILGDDQQYLFDALPHIYRVMLKLNKDLQPD
uniref:Uncharacterized protein n=1 Tax=Ciona savignyi TaxID=51511 RepID=H2YP47_CIOSA